MSSIPGSEIVQVLPSVLGVGGNSLDIIMVALTKNTRVPIGTVQKFGDATSVLNFFGPGAEVNIADVYFTGFTGAQTTPAALYFTQYPATAVAAYLRGGNISGLTLAQIQAISGSLDITVDGYPRTAGSLNLSASTSFSNAASIIQTALNAGDPNEATVTASIGAGFTASGSGTNLTVSAVAYGIISVGDTISGAGVPANTTIVSQTSGSAGGTGVYVTSNATTSSSASLDAASTVLDVATVGSGTVAPGQSITGSGVTEAVITAQLTGTAGGVGTYRISGAQQTVIPPESMTAVGTPVVVTYDSVSGAFIVASGATGAPSTVAFATGTVSATLLLTAATSAVLSQGAAAAVPGTFMDRVIAQTTDWVTYMTAFDPDGGSGNTVKQAFAAWKNTALGGNRFAYICWDTDPNPRTTLPATSSLGYILANNGDSGTFLISELADNEIAPFVGGAAASIDFEQTNGRITFAGKNQAGLVADVTTSTAALNLAGNPQAQNFDPGNGYNFYGAYANANANFIWLQRGFVTGKFKWFDSYINQIWWNNAFKNALLNLIANTLSIPFSVAGTALIEAALADPIQAGLKFGAAAPGSISAAQAAEVNNLAGSQIAATLQTQGYYLQIPVAPSATRAARGPLQGTFFYLDRGSVQAISLASIALQ